MRVSRLVLLAVVVGFGAIQLYPRTHRENPAVTGEVKAPPEVQRILRRACYDCHSNETHWPAYSYVAPFSWLLISDVEKGRSRLNFSTWATQLPPRFQAHYRKRVLERLEKGEMPPSRYLLLHPSARIREEEIELIRAWSQEGGESP